MNPSEQEAILAFIQETVRHARSLPISEARAYLYGFLMMGDDHSQILEPVRALYHSFCEVDQQLELITSGQLKFTFASKS